MDKEDVAYMHLFGQVLSGVDHPTDGLYWTDLQGWWGLPDLKASSDSIPGAHGSFEKANHYRESRVITVVGHILADSPAGLAAVRQRLETALAAGAGEMSVTTGAYGTWFRTVEVDTLDIEPDHGKRSTKFTVDMIAHDPIRYSELLTAGPATLPIVSGGLMLPDELPWSLGTSIKPVATVVNTGELPLLPRIIVTGSAPSLTVKAGAYILQFGAFDGTLVFDSLQRRAWLNGFDVTADIIRRGWPVVQPGATADFLFDYDGVDIGTELIVEYRIGVW